MKSTKLCVLMMGVVLLLGLAFSGVDQAFAQNEFIRGDADGDCLVGLNDIAYIIGYLYLGCPDPPCKDAADANDDGIVSVGDNVYLIDYLFRDGTEPPAPFPLPGTDPTPDDLNCLAECVPLPLDPVDLLIASDASGEGGEVDVVVSITAENSEDLYGYQIFLDYDENILEATSVEISQPADPDVFESNIDVDNGEVEIVCIVDCDEVESIPAGVNELVRIIFSVDPEAPLGATVLDLNNVIDVPFRGNLFTYAGGKVYPNLTDGNFTVLLREFIRGDADGDCLVGLNDIAYNIGYLYLGCPDPPCKDAADANDDGIVNVGDNVYLIDYLFRDGTEPPAPFPLPGTDPTPDDLNCLAECVPLPLDPVDLLIAGDASGGCGETEVVVSITAENNEDLFGYQIFLDYDENSLEATSVEISQPADPDVFESNIDVDNGEVEIVCIVDCFEVENIPAGTNELVTITFSVNPEAPLGATVLDLNNVIDVPFRGNLFTYAEGKVYPNLTDGNFTVVPAPSITAVTDVGNDQGRQVRVNWNRSCYDLVGSPVTITEYGIWRRIDDDKADSQSEEIFPSYSGMLDEGRDYPPGDWDFIKTVPARGEETYNTICPTLGDYTEEQGIYWSVFFVSAMTSDPLVYYDSNPDSGYSEDNIPPLPIQDLGIDPNSWFTLGWTVPGEYVGEEPIANYDIRYNTVPVGPDTQAWWDTAEACAGEGFFNLMVGEKDSFQVAGECGCHPEIYLAIKGLDDRPNASQISNIVYFMCGDVGGDGVVDLDDVLYLISYLYKGGVPPEPMAAGDATCDEIIDLGDLLHIISYLYKGGLPPCGL